MTIVAAADGSALGNPGPAGWAWYVDDSCWRAGGWPHGTNNMGELMAVLDLFRSTAHMAEEPLKILCDSQYVINCVTKWMPGWKRKGWRKADGKPVLNVDLLKDIDAAIVGRNYSFEWVKGHAGHPLNEAADDRARAAATAYQAKREPMTGPGFPGADLTGAGAASADEGANSSQVLQSPASRNNNVPDQLEQPDLFSLFDDAEDPNFAPAKGAALEDVLELERELLDPLVRADALRVAELLHPEFVEFGSSGRAWQRGEMIDLLSNEASVRVDIEPLELKLIAPETALLLYRSSSPEKQALRSSIWNHVDGRWQLRFHQGTLEA